MKAAMAMEKSSENEGGGSSGMGTSLGLMLPAMFAQYFHSTQAGGAKADAVENPACPDCRSSVPTDAKFCPQCGHQMVVFTQCARCGKNLAPNSKFCSRCGSAVQSQPQKNLCKNCGAENLSESIYCNDCGEKL
jgi:predicted amidophosphoribosyltransferase